MFFVRIELKLKLKNFCFFSRSLYFPSQWCGNSEPKKSTCLYIGRYVDSQIVHLNPFFYRICSNFVERMSAIHSNRPAAYITLYRYTYTYTYKQTTKRKMCISHPIFLSYEASMHTHTFYTSAFCSVSVLLLLPWLPLLLSLS